MLGHGVLVALWDSDLARMYMRSVVEPDDVRTHLTFVLGLVGLVRI